MGKRRLRYVSGRPGHSRVEAEPDHVWNQAPQTPVWRQHPGREMPLRPCSVRVRVAVPGRLAARRERGAGSPGSRPGVLARPWPVPSPPVCFPMPRSRQAGRTLPEGWFRAGSPRSAWTVCPHARSPPAAPQPCGACLLSAAADSLLCYASCSGPGALACSGAPPGGRQLSAEREAGGGGGRPGHARKRPRLSPMPGEARSASWHSGLAAARGWPRAVTRLARVAGWIGEGRQGGGVPRGTASITASRSHRACQVVVEPGPGAHVLGNAIAM